MTTANRKTSRSHDTAESRHWVDLLFPAHGAAIPRRHGYAVYQAIANQGISLGQVHGIGVFPIRGERAEAGTLLLRDDSVLRIRLPAGAIPLLPPLTNRRLGVGHVTREIPLAQLESLAIVGPVQLSTQALHALADRCVPVGFMSSAGRLIAVLDPLDSVSSLVRRAQVRELEQPLRALELSRALIAAKILNQRVLLQRNGEGVPDAALEELACQAEQARTCNDIDVLRGHEGQAAAVYFEHFAAMVKSNLAGEFDRNGRSRRPPPDPINATLSLAYTMLAHECVSALRLARLEPSIGALHTSRPGRPALALDLMEPFRPLIADSVAISCFSRGELEEGHFMRTAAGCIMTDSGRRAFFGAWGRRMDTEITHSVFGYRLSYRRMLMLHARLIAAWLLGEAPTLAFLTTR